MFSMTDVPLSPQATARLRAVATYHGSLTRLRVSLVVKMTGIFVALLCAVAGIMVAAFWWFDALPDLQRRLPAALWALGLLYGYLLIVALWDSRYTHEALREQHVRAAAALADGRETEVVVEFDGASFAMPHEHGMFYCVDDGLGGTVLLEVSTIADDPRETQAGRTRQASHWQLHYCAGGIQRARFSGPRMSIRRIEGLDEGGASALDRMLEVLGVSGVPDLARVALPIQEAERRVRDVLAKDSAPEHRG
jgi:hypothetical protein